ncbi:MAG: VOC family protein [Candidatus Dormibacteraceae bacterium]
MKKLDGIHHISAITADGPRNADFYARVIGLRLVKKTVNQDDPTVYHLFYADEQGSPGSDLTFFEYPGARSGRPGAGMVHRISFRVASEAALDFWRERLASEGITGARDAAHLLFQDPEGLGLELIADGSDDAPLVAVHPEIPHEVAIRGFAGARAFSRSPETSRAFLERTLGFAAASGTEFESRGDSRSSFYGYDASDAPGVGGAGTVHHIAFACRTEDHEAWRERVLAGGGAPTPVIDRYYFRSVYFREPSGVLFEIATVGPGFSADEPLESLGTSLALPPKFEPMRERLEGTLRPIPNPRASWATTARPAS